MLITNAMFGSDFTPNTPSSIAILIIFSIEIYLLRFYWRWLKSLRGTSKTTFTESIDAAEASIAKSQQNKNSTKKVDYNTRYYIQYASVNGTDGWITESPISTDLPSMCKKCDTYKARNPKRIYRVGEMTESGKRVTVYTA